MEELAKYSITSIELKHLFNLISMQGNDEHKKLLLDTLIKVSSSSVLSAVNAPAEYFDIQSSANGIQVSDINRWELAGNGFVFHTWLRLDKFVLNAEETDCQNFRRYVFTLINSQDCGYEIFVTKNGNLVLGVTTKKDFYTTTVASECLNDGRWHSISIIVNPPKRLFSYHQINIFVDGNQKVGSNIKYGAFVEPFLQCSIGIPHTPIRQSTWYQEKEKNKVLEEKPKSLFERSFFSHVPSFTLPLKSSGSLDPSVKNYPIGMQDIVFGQSLCLKGQMGYTLLADPTVNLKAIHEAGPSIATIMANDLIEGFDLGTKFVFCFSPSACQISEGMCIDISPSEQHVSFLLKFLLNNV